jgi:hypothetical protein
MNDARNLKLRIGAATKLAHACVESAADVRARLRRRARPGSPNRQADLLEQLALLNEAGARLRSLIGCIQWPQYELSGTKYETNLRNSSGEIERERRKLRKMLR